ncbi:MAG: class I SAM-dependent methyltransferase, partial [Planctomycetota bacterium]
EGLVSAAGRAELLRGLADIGDDRLLVEVLEQTSGIRAGTRQRNVLIRVHSEHPQLGLFNGLGSWGSLTAPASATALLDLQEDCLRAGPAAVRASLAGTTLPGRQLPPQRTLRQSLTQLAHSMARRAFRAGDRVLDATAGNGHDTRFLADLAGAAAVTAIDLQPAAIAATRKRLGEAAEQVLLITGEHARELERIGRELQERGDGGTRPFGVIMFNLGYLPGSDRSVITQAETTHRALTASLQLLRPRGVLTVIVYRGHPGSAAEYAAVKQVAAACSELRVDVVPGNVSDETSPVLFAFRAPAMFQG